jgi:amidase
MTSDESKIGRRDFLRGASAVGVAIAAAPLLAAKTPAPESSSDITALSATELSRAIRQRKVSCFDVMRAYLDRINRLNPIHNALVSLRDEEELLAEARRADGDMEKGRYRGWMHGMPHAVKDLADAKGLPTSHGSRLFAGTVAKADSLFVSRIREAGPIFIGKTNTPEFGFGSQTYNDVFGTTFNAYDPTLCAGGSSGGAAVGLATQMLPVADGSDMMGSLRNPAAFNNVIGFRPSQGRVPEYPHADAYLDQLSVSGPMGRNVEDTIRLLGTMAGHDARDPLSLRDRIPPFEDFVPAGLDGFRIGWMGDFKGYLATEPGVLDLCKSALRSLQPHGVVVEDCTPDYDMARLWRTWLTFRHWSASDAGEIYENPELRRLVKPEIIWEIEGSFDITASRLKEAGVARTDWYRALLALFERHDVLALPTAQVFPFDAKLHWPKSIDGKPMDTYHRWMEVVIGGTLAGLPVVSLPAGFNADGIPMGMQFLGRFGEDQKVLEFALSYERVLNR